MNIDDGVIYCFFRMGLATGILERPVVVAWADRMILERAQLTEEMMELSLSAKLPYSQLVKDLNLYQGAKPDHDLAAKLLLAEAERQLAEQPGRAVALLRNLRLLLAEGFLPLEIRRELAELDKLLELYFHNQLAVEVEVIHARLSGFLERYREFYALVREIIE